MFKRYKENSSGTDSGAFGLIRKSVRCLEKSIQTAHFLFFAFASQQLPICEAVTSGSFAMTTRRTLKRMLNGAVRHPERQVVTTGHRRFGEVNLPARRRIESSAAGK